MNIQNIIIDAIASTSAVDAICEKTGLKKTQVKSIIKLAVPMLTAAMAKNASTKEGAAALEGATKKHQSDESVEKQLKNADVEDGAKIIQHILGGNASAVTSAVAKESGAEADDVAKVLATFAPAMLGSMSGSPVTDALGGIDLSDGIDAKDVLGVLGKLMK